MAQNESYKRAIADGLKQITGFITPEQKEKLRILSAYENITMQRVVGLLIDEFWKNNAQRYVSHLQQMHGERANEIKWPST